MRPSRKLHFAPEALQDLQDIWDYLGQFDEAAANHTIDTIAASYRRLPESPYIGRSRDEIAPGLRSIVATNYVLFYRVDDEVVVIARIVHGARNLSALFNAGKGDVGRN